jgi:hypothetical protein
MTRRFHDHEPTSRKRPTVHEVAGADDEVRGRVSSSADAVHGAAGNLREAVHDLHDARDVAWKRNAAEDEEATVRFDAAMDVATSRLRAERAETSEELAGDGIWVRRGTWADELAPSPPRHHGGSLCLDGGGSTDRAGNRLGKAARSASTPEGRSPNCAAGPPWRSTRRGGCSPTGPRTRTRTQILTADGAVRRAPLFEREPVPVRGSTLPGWQKNHTSWRSGRHVLTVTLNRPAKNVLSRPCRGRGWMEA